MKAKYIGDPSQPREGVPETFEAFGITFHKGKFSPVPDDLASKFAGNSHFETSNAKAPQLDHDKDGKEGGSEPDGDGPFDGMTVVQLKELAADRGVDLGDATKKADIIAALELAAEADTDAQD